MKIDRVEITNFAGIQHFLMEDLGIRDEVVIVGRNGVGKSQILLAIATAWNSEGIGDYSKYLGPYGPALSICVRYSLDDDDIHELNNRANSSEYFPEFQGRFLVNELEFKLFSHTAGTFRDERGNDFTELIRGRNGAAFAPLNWLSFLPADRIVGRSMQQNLALQGLASKQVAETNSQVVNQIFQDWHQPHQFDVTDNLMTGYFADVLQSQATGQTVEQGIYQEVSDAWIPVSRHDYAARSTLFAYRPIFVHPSVRARASLRSQRSMVNVLSRSESIPMILKWGHDRLLDNSGVKWYSYH